MTQILQNYVQSASSNLPEIFIAEDPPQGFVGNCLVIKTLQETDVDPGYVYCCSCFNFSVDSCRHYAMPVTARKEKFACGQYDPLVICETCKHFQLVSVDEADPRYGGNGKESIQCGSCLLKGFSKVAWNWSCSDYVDGRTKD